MATAQQVLDVARSQLGVHEDPPHSNRTPYTAWYGMVGPWCAMFASWCLHKVGIDEWRHAYTPSGFEIFRRAGRLVLDKPQAGDLVYFDFPNDTVRRISHVGFVEKVLPDGRIVTIEGNTNAAGSRTGGSVLRHTRDPIRHGVRGYGRPAYDPPAAAAARPQEADVLGKDQNTDRRGVVLHGFVTVLGRDNPASNTIVVDGKPVNELNFHVLVLAEHGYENWLRMLLAAPERAA